MVIDTSALLAVLFAEEDRDVYLRHLCGRERKTISPLNALEADIVVQSRKGDPGHQALERILYNCEIVIIPFDSAMRTLAYEGWLRFGKGRHQASLNMGDCCAYALARYLNEPLLYKGNDFVRTDIQSVI
ncbi:type II toxin-antitoxin system VapC family toxin [Oceanispirochaeta sp.]|uniref:type II toxin-antitoxin system VapC family toxin n=1 Tax=Oceanispirochaeta sp. TaxID=2035350 RepID=UPI00260CC9D9|nr:type II toxin-antitoxin system VapC family toxin [Oceanispirochaeta sp.]MDA3956828.1 type II toxin-antitoxin system VapC family toxin [Oceanispirochaeta sp.]